MQTPTLSVGAASRRLRNYYATRAAFSVAWVALAFTLGRGNASIAGPLLLLYPAWDALANWVDARRSGGLGRNRSQALNVAISVATTIAVAIALRQSMYAVLGVFGVWAILAGLFQLATGVRRWKTFGAQWPMILSGAQSALAGGFMIVQAHGPKMPDITAIAPYAGFGAFYFLVSTIALTVKARRATA